MSFQDIGRRGPSSSSSAVSSSPYRPQASQYNNNNSSSSASPSAKYRSGGVSGFAASGTGGGGHSAAIVQPIVMNDGDNNEYSAISQAILQYQQNVGIFSNIIQSIGSTRTPYDTQVLTQQYDLQTDVIQQLSSKILLQLEQVERQTASRRKNNSNNDQQQLQQHRATHLKLKRDYNWVETKYKNLQLDAKRKWNMMEMERMRITEEEQRKNLENDLDHDATQLQIQIQDDRIVEEIMRERAEEVRNINKGMHQVNEIYKDLATIVSHQQDQVDEVEVTMEEANKHAESGLKQIEKAHAKSIEGNCIIS